jgi:hypothetical protein
MGDAAGRSWIKPAAARIPKGILVDFRGFGWRSTAASATSLFRNTFYVWRVTAARRNVAGVPDYERSTEATTLDGLPEPIRAAVLDRPEAAQLTVAADAPAYLTLSRRLKKPGLLGRLTGTADRDAEHLTALVLGGRDVLVATHGEQRGTTVLTARLEDVAVGSVADRLVAAGAAREDEGVTVTGFPVAVEGAGGRGSFFVALGPPDGATARATLEDAVRPAKA